MFQTESFNKVFGDTLYQGIFKSYPEILKRVQNVEKNSIEQGDKFLTKKSYYTEAFRSGNLNEEFGRF